MVVRPGLFEMVPFLVDEALEHQDLYAAREKTIGFDLGNETSRTSTSTL